MKANIIGCVLHLESATNEDKGRLLEYIGIYSCKVKFVHVNASDTSKVSVSFVDDIDAVGAMEYLDI